MTKTHLVRVMFERFASIRLFDVRLVAIARYAKYLIIILRLATLERCFGTFELASQRAHVRVRALKLGLLEGGPKVGDGVFVLLIMKPDACPRAQRFERAWLEEQASLGIDEGVIVARKLWEPNRTDMNGKKWGVMRRDKKYLDEGGGAVGQ
jgi:hypothetical protein